MTTLSAGRVWLIVVLLAVLGFTVWGFAAAWKLAGDTPMSVHGWIAMSLAAVLVTGLGGGLMWLAFYSSRHGYDDEQGRDGE
jgi:drug/metabolite transporter (DMT)-like permease